MSQSIQAGDAPRLLTAVTPEFPALAPELASLAPEFPAFVPELVSLAPELVAASDLRVIVDLHMLSPEELDQLKGVAAQGDCISQVPS